jgi:FtsZ-interacting cell division protein ZipA
MAIFNGWRITRAGVVFVIGILVLAGLVFGGIWFVNERGEQARRDEAIKIAQQQLEEQSEVARETNNGTAVTDEGEENSPAPSTNGEENVELPETGPEIVHILAITALTLSTAYYVGSRRALGQL